MNRYLKPFNEDTDQTMKAAKDKYVSRVDGAGQIINREDPVVHGDADGPLSDQQVTTYSDQGFLFFDSFFNDEAVQALVGESEKLRVSEEVRQSEAAVTEASSGETRSIYSVHSVSELFSQLAADQRIVEIVRQLLDSDIYLHQSRLNLKPGFRGKEFYWHSDFETWHSEDGMPEMRAISCSIALTDNYEFNGPLLMIPGSHKYYCQCSGLTPDTHYQQSLNKQDYGVPSDEQLTWMADQSGIVSPKGPAGSVVLFDCNMMHGSNGNITPFPRKNAFFVYNSMENTLCEPFAAEFERPWYLGNRNPERLAPVDFSASIAERS